MKIVFLNTWNGKIKDGITKFITEESRTADIFCFQEVYDAMRLLCKELLPNHREFLVYKHFPEEGDFHQATYVKKEIKVLSSEIVPQSDMPAGLGVYTQIQSGNDIFHIGNFHCLSQPGDKLDNPDRIKQSQGLIEFFQDKDCAKIFGGDFNLLPQTKSIQMFEENGYRDLIKEFKIPTTRNRLVWKRFPANKEYYSDYVFVSPEVKVKNFSVPNIEISDHLPLILEFD